jgi:hypothetical protein
MMWRPIPGWDRYEVSDHGQVRSADMGVRAKGDARAIRKGRVLTCVTTAAGYHAVTLTDGIRKQQMLVHRLVAAVFIGPPPHPEAHVLHGDGSRTNNCVQNLRWGTPADNHADTLRHGHRRAGETHPMAKLRADDVRFIRKSNVNAGFLAEKFGVSREHIWAVRRGKTWKDIT